MAGISGALQKLIGVDKHGRGLNACARIYGDLKHW